VMGSFVATSPNNPDRWGASWPPAGRKDGHQWGEKVAADGEKPMAIDKPATRCTVEQEQQRGDDARKACSTFKRRNGPAPRS
jgi:hypothetical protein